MRITRFLDDDGHLWIGEPDDSGSAAILLDAEGVLGESHARQVSRELLKGKRVLVADDDPGIRQTVGAALERFDCRCTFCADGRSAVSAVQDGHVDIVVSDIVMPECDGYQVLAAAKATTPSPPVVLITGYGYDPGHRLVRATDQGVDAVLYKPFSPQQLVGRVTEAIRGSTEGASDLLVRTSRRIPMGRKLAPIAPKQILCAGRNSIAGPAPASDDELELFMKPLGCVQGPGKPIRIPSIEGGAPHVAVEGEIAVIIGREARDVTAHEAIAARSGIHDRHRRDRTALAARRQADDLDAGQGLRHLLSPRARHRQRRRDR